MSSLVPLPKNLDQFLEPYFPKQTSSDELPFVTLSYAQSLDSRISIAPGVQTAISHLETKTMTHFIRSKHDAILVGVGTVLADDPKLNCRYTPREKSHIVPVVIDPHFKCRAFLPNSLMLNLYRQGLGAKPIVVISETLNQPEEDIGVDLVVLPLKDGKISWTDILKSIRSKQLNSVMVEGGGKVINDLLTYKTDSGDSVVNSLIITIGPVFLGVNGVEVSPESKLKLKNVKWWTGTQDAVVAANLAI